MIEILLSLLSRALDLIAAVPALLAIAVIVIAFLGD